MRRADLALGLVVAAVGAYALSLALDMSMYGANRVPGPGFFPTLLAGLLLGLGLLLAATSVRRRHEPAADGSAGAAGRADPDSRGDWHRQARAGTVLLCYAVSVPLLGLLGFVPTAALLVFALLFGVEGRRNWGALSAAILIPVAASIIFVDLLTIPLPQGLLSHGPLGI
jgi:putative tricarboxylic transport membrane protein